MLIKFSCKAHENIIMFGDVALTLLKLMGHSGAVPGAILADDVADALAHLQQAIGQQKQTSELLGNEGSEPEVSLAHRALPLMAMLQDAVKHQCNVMWDKG